MYACNLKYVYSDYFHLHPLLSPSLLCPFSLFAMNPISTFILFHFVLSATEFIQGYHRFGTIHWSPVVSAVKTQMKTMTLSIPEPISSQ